MKKLNFILLFIFVLWVVGYSQQDNENLQPPIILNNFLGGLNTKTATNLLSPTQSPDLLNVILDDTNALRMRDGFSLAYTLPVSSNVKILNSFVAVFDDGSSYFIVHAGSGVYQTQGGTEWSIIVNGISPDFPLSFCMYKGEVWLTNGVDNVGIWNRMNYTTYNFIPKGKYIIADKEQLLISGIFSQPSSVMFSNLTDETGVFATAKTSLDWPAVNELRIGEGDGQIITGMYKMANKVYIAKESSIYGILTSADYKDSQIILYSTLYGSVSNKSISDYKTAKIIFGKRGLSLFDGNNAEIISTDIENILTQIGIVSGGSKRWTTSTNVDFSTGVFENCFNDIGTIEISSSSKVWTTTADFGTGAIGSTQTTSANDKVELLTTAGVKLVKVEPYYYYGAGLEFGNGMDGDINTFSDIIFDGEWWASSYFRSHLYGEKIRQFELVFTPIDYSLLYDNQVLTENRLFFSVAYNWGYINLTDAPQAYTYSAPELTSPFTDLQRREAFVYWADYPDYSPRTATLRIPDHIFNDPTYTSINVRWYFSAHHKKVGVKIFEMTGYKEETISPYFSSGTFISPIFDSGSLQTGYRFLYPNDYKGKTPSTGTITYETRTSTSSNMGDNPTWYGLGISSAINDNCDNKRYFQWKADLWTSSGTMTPSIYDITLDYVSVITSTYTSKVFNVGNRLTSWGNFVGDHTGTINYEIRGATYPFAINDTNLLWISQGNNSSIILSTSSAYIQWRAKTTGKNTKLEGVSINWYEGSTFSTGGLQDTPSINYKDRYYFAYSTWTLHNTDVLILDKNGKFIRYDWKVSDFNVFNNRFYICSSNQPLIFEVLTGTNDNEMPINMYWKSGDMDFGISDITKEYRYLYITGKKQPNSFAYIDTYINHSSIPIDTRYCDLSNDNNFRLQLSSQTYGKNIAIVIRSTASACEVQSVNMFWRPKTLR